MRNLYAGGGLLAAASLLLAGLIVVAGPGNTPSAQAQAACSDDEAHCLVITKQTDPANADQDFNFGSTEGAFSIGHGESWAISFEGTGPIIVSENDSDGWTLTDITCSGDDDYVTVNAGSNAVIADFGDWDEDGFGTISCTFTNEQDASPTPTSTAPSATQTATPGATSTPATPTPISSGTVTPPNTGTAGLKR